MISVYVFLSTLNCVPLYMYVNFVTAMFTGCVCLS